MKNKTPKLIARYLVPAKLYMAGVVRQALALTLSLAVAVSTAMAASDGFALPKAVRTRSHLVRNVEYFIGGTGAPCLSHPSASFPAHTIERSAGR